MRTVVEVLRHRFDAENTKVAAGPVPLVLGGVLFEPAVLLGQESGLGQLQSTSTISSWESEAD